MRNEHRQERKMCATREFPVPTKKGTSGPHRILVALGLILALGSQNVHSQGTPAGQLRSSAESLTQALLTLNVRIQSASSVEKPQLLNELSQLARARQQALAALLQTDAAAALLRVARDCSATLGVSFHVGSQCLSPFSYAQAIEIAQRTITLSGVEIAALDIGGGFPAAYSGQEPPPYHWYFDMIKEALTTLGRPDLNVMCEPGRALCAPGISLVTQVVMRRGDRLYLNDGIYGSFDEQRFIGFDEDYPPTAITLDARGKAKALSGEKRPFRAYGPTCDSADVLPRPVMLPNSIAAGDYILFDAMGAYTVSSRSTFNGYYPDSWAIVG